MFDLEQAIYVRNDQLFPVNIYFSKFITLEHYV
jgi:hypothetical protein